MTKEFDYAQMDGGDQQRYFKLRTLTAVQPKGERSGLFTSLLNGSE